MISRKKIKLQFKYLQNNTKLHILCLPGYTTMEEKPHLKPFEFFHTIIHEVKQIFLQRFIVFSSLRSSQAQFLKSITFIKKHDLHNLVWIHVATIQLILSISLKNAVETPKVMSQNYGFRTKSKIDCIFILNNVLVNIVLLKV